MAVKPRKREPENFVQVEGVTNSDNSIETCPTSKQSTDFVQASHVASRDIAVDKPWVAQGKSWKRVRKDITFRFFYDMDQTSYVT